MATFDLDQPQAQAILDMQLRRLAALEREKLEQEYQQLQETIKGLQELLGDESKILDVIKDENLQSNALDVGSHLLSQLNALKSKHELIGDVRGAGLFIGIELVKDRNTLEPAVEEADLIINKMKDKGLLLSTDGSDHNVIKIKPPLIFTKENADILVEQMDESLYTL